MAFDKVFICLGSNLGDRLDYLKKALIKIAHFPDTKVINCSSVYESAPVGFLNQDDFLNVVAQISTNYSPQLFLASIQKIELELGRVRSVNWGQRTIDIDLLYWGNVRVNTGTLHIPHPEISNRRFVLVPLNEIASNFEAPPKYKKIHNLLENVADDSRVELYLPIINYELS